MDQVAINIAANVMTSLLPFITKGADEFIGKFGEDAYEKTKKLLSTLRHKLAKDENATSTLKLLEQKPQTFRSAFEEILQEKLAEDEGLRADISNFLQKEAPYLELIQMTEEGKNLRVLKVRDMRGGTIKAKQEATKRLEDSTVAEFDTLG